MLSGRGGFFQCLIAGVSSWLTLQLCSCALPSIHREGEGADAAVSSTAKAAATAVDDDAGVPDPFADPRNRGEDLATFMTLIPKAHVFATWPMPDTGPHAKTMPSYSVTEHVVTDNVTKLRWQRVLPESYPGCTGHYMYVGRDRGQGSGCTWGNEAESYCQSAELVALLGPGEWRLPTKIELESLIDTSRVNAVDALFDGFPIDFVWTSTPYLNPTPSGLKLSWNIDFTNGESNNGARFKGGRVRCVASSEQTGGSAPDYDLTLETVLDKHTLLMWQRYPDSATRAWRDALDYCERLALDGGGWRLPSLKELLTIVDSTRRDPAVDVAAFLQTKNERYWSASEYLDSEDSAYQVDFTDGGTWTKGTFADEHYARCVR